PPFPDAVIVDCLRIARDRNSTGESLALLQAQTNHLRVKRCDKIQRSLFADEDIRAAVISVQQLRGAACDDVQYSRQLALGADLQLDLVKRGELSRLPAQQIGRLLALGDVSPNANVSSVFKADVGETSIYHSPVPCSGFEIGELTSRRGDEVQNNLTVRRVRIELSKYVQVAALYFIQGPPKPTLPLSVDQLDAAIFVKES